MIKVKKDNPTSFALLKTPRSCFIGFALSLLIIAFFNKINVAESGIFAQIHDTLYFLLESFLNVLAFIGLSPFIVFSVIATAFNYIGLDTTSPLTFTPYLLLTICLFYKVTRKEQKYSDQIRKHLPMIILNTFLVLVLLFVISIASLTISSISIVENGDSGMHFYIYDVLSYIATITSDVTQHDIIEFASIYLQEDSDILIDKYGNHPYFYLMYHAEQNSLFYAINILQSIIVTAFYFIYTEKN